MTFYYSLSFNQFNVWKSTVLHNVSNSVEQNVDGKGRLLLEAVMGLRESQTLEKKKSQWGSLGKYGAATSVFHWALMRESILDAFYYRLLMKLRWHHQMFPRLEMLTFPSPHLRAAFDTVWHSRQRETCCVADFARLYSSHRHTLL